MTPRHHRRARYPAALLGLLLSSLAQAAPTPSPEEVEGALKAALATQSPPAAVKVRAVSACFPAHGRAPGEIVCLADLRQKDGEFLPRALALRQEKQVWKALPDADFIPACASTAEAQRQLRGLLGNGRLTVKEQVDGGAGDFTEERGIARDKKGPLRLMCRYLINQGSGKKTDDRLAITYLWSVKGKYRFDPDVEIWD